MATAKNDARTDHQDIRIGTMAGKGEKTAEYIAAIAHHGFETYEINFWQALPVGYTLKKMAKDVKRVLDEAGTGAQVGALGMYGNPLEDRKTAQAWAKCIDAAADFGTDIVQGFAGGVVGEPVRDSMKQYKKVFGPLAKRAADKGVRIAFENCQMGSTWTHAKMNIAYNPRAWELMYDVLPAENIGLAWEPCHQMCQLIDPIAQLRRWVDKVFIVHGKDATIYHDKIAEHGIDAGNPIVHHRTPGFGDSNWTDIISILRQNNFRGAIHIEGWHDPVYKGDLEMTGQVHALNYLKQCRGGAYVPDPKGF